MDGLVEKGVERERVRERERKEDIYFDKIFYFNKYN